MGVGKITKKRSLRGKHAIVTGGSSGIGRAVSELIIRSGGSVCVIARNEKVLTDAAERMKELISGDDQFVETISCDTTDKEKLDILLNNYIKRYGVPDILVNNVGFAYPQYIERLTLEDFENAMRVNYFGQVIPTLILLPHFMKERKGHIANVSSFSGLLGIMGYGSYTPSKFAIAGFSEVLRNELKPYNIKVSVIYPSDTKTPGFDEENKNKPEECAIMSESGGLHEPEEVAEALIKGIIKNRFNIVPGSGGLYWRIKRFFPGIVYRIIDQDLARARKKAGKN